MPSHLWWPLFDLYKLQLFLFPSIPSPQCDVDQREEWGQVWKTAKVLLTQENSRSGTSRCLMTLYIVFILQGKHCSMSPHPLLKTVGVSVFSDRLLSLSNEKKKVSWEDGRQRSQYRREFHERLEFCLQRAEPTYWLSCSHNFLWLHESSPGFRHTTNEL